MLYWGHLYRQESVMAQELNSVALRMKCLYERLSISTSRKLSLYFVHIFGTDWNFFSEIWQLWSKFQLDHFDLPILAIWNICACANCSYSYYTYYYKLLDMIWIWNLHWGNLFDKRSWSLILSTWSREFFIKIYFARWILHLPFAKVCYVQKSALWLV